MGSYLVSINQASHIGMYYAMQGIVSLFMPAILGIIADRWIPAPEAIESKPFSLRFIHGRSRILRNELWNKCLNFRFYLHYIR